MTMYRLRLPLRDSQQEPHLCRCTACRGELFAGEPVFRPEPGELLCTDCFRSWVGKYLNRAPRLLAEQLGVHSEELGEVSR